MSFLGGGPGGSFDTGPEVSPVGTPDQKKLGRDHGQGLKESNIVGHFFAVLFDSLIAGLEIIIKNLVGVFDEFLALFVGLVTAFQGNNTPGFWDLEAKIINDFLGVEVAGDELKNAAASKGLIGGLQAAGSDFLNVLINTFSGNAPSAKGGPTGLPGEPGVPLSPDAGLKGAAAFLGFIMSFAIREGNLETAATALPESIRMFEGIRSYGRILAAGLGFGRLSRRVLQPLIQERIVGPMQLALNKQYRPKVLDPKQIALSFIRQGIDRSDFFDRMAFQGYTDTDIRILLDDTYTRLSANQLFELHETGAIDDEDHLKRMQQLGYNTFDVPLVRQARALELTRAIDRTYITTAISDLHHGLIDLSTFEHDVDSTGLTPEEKAAYKRNGANRAAARERLLTIGFLKRAYLDAAIDLTEFLDHVKLLGYSQDDVDIIEQEVLIEQKVAADKVKAHAAKVASKTTKKSTPPAPATGG